MLVLDVTAPVSPLTSADGPAGNRDVALSRTIIGRLTKGAVTAACDNRPPCSTMNATAAVQTSATRGNFAGKTARGIASRTARDDVLAADVGRGAENIIAPTNPIDTSRTRSAKAITCQRTPAGGPTLRNECDG